jgi:hypothetical protein
MEWALPGFKYILAFQLTFQLAIFACSGFALEPVLFGPEFTFMHDQNFPNGELLRHIECHLVTDQPEGAKFHRDQSYEGRITWNSPNGWWTAIYEDSGGFEVNTKAMTLNDFKKYAADLQDAIFVSAANTGHFPALWQGGGHINIDVTIFRKNPLLFRNFMVDLFNHNELYMGIFNYDFSNARPFQLMFYRNGIYLEELGLNRAAGFDVFFRRFLADLDAEIPNPASQDDFDSIAEKFRLKFHTCMYGSGAINLNKLNESRVELRAVRPQASIDVFIRQIELLEARLRYLEKLKSPISSNSQVPLMLNTDEELSKDTLTPPVEPQAALRAFYNYVTESGQPWRNHRDYLWPQWISGGELEKFEMSEWFKSRERGCAKLLEKLPRII